MADYLNIAGRVRTTAADGVAVEAQEIKDLQLDKNQQEINADVQTELSDRYTKEETYSQEQLNSLITTPDVEYVNVVATDQTTDVTDVLPAEGAGNTIYRVANWNGTQYDATVYSLYAWNSTGYVCLAVRSFVGEVYDISANHPDGQGNPTPYADLTAALAYIPIDIRHGGMSVKFIQGTEQSSDNKYVHYVLTKDQWSPFVTDWKQILTYGKEIVTLLTPFETVDDTYIKTGTAGSAPSTATSNKTKIAKYNVTAGNNYLFSAKQASSVNLYIITWVDASGNIVSQEYKGTSGQVDIWTDILLIAPVNAVTMWMNVWSAYSKSANFKSVTTEFIDVAELESQVEQNTSNIAEIQNILTVQKGNLLTPFETVDNTYVKTGTAGSAVSTGTSDNGEIAKYNVTAGNNYLFSATQHSTINVYTITWVDASGNIVSQEYKGKYGQVDRWTDIPLTAPVNAVTMWMNVYSLYSKSANFKSVTTGLVDIVELEGQVEQIKNEKEQKKKLRLLLIGNSHSQDSLAYVPFILKNMDIDVDYQIGIAMLSSSTLSQHVSNFENENAVYKYHLYDGETAWKVQTGKTLQYILDDKVWDIIFLQDFPLSNAGSSQPQLNKLINLIAAYIPYPVKFGWHADYGLAANGNSGPNKSDERITADYEIICTNARNVMEDTVCEILVSTATAVQNARSIASLKAMGDYANNPNNTSGLGYLMANDGVHLQEGLPSQIAAYTFVLVLLDVLGCKNRSIIGETTRVTSEWTADKNIPGPHGDCVGSTDENCYIAQKCAIMAVKKPYEMTDMNYIVNPT